MEPVVVESMLGSSARSAAGNLRLVTLISLVSAMGGFLFGYETVVIAGTISLVKAQFGLSALMEGWYVSSGLAGCVAGVVLAGGLCDRAGRKRVMILSGGLLAGAAIGCAIAMDATWLVIARSVGGVGVGLASIVSPLYISEVAPPQFRGRLVSLFQLTITLGIVAAMLINVALLHHALDAAAAAGRGLWHSLFVSQVWRGMFLIQLVPAVLFFMWAFRVPESPRWLALRGQTGLAGEVLAKLRGDKQLARSELESIRVALATAAGRVDTSGGMSAWRAADLGEPLFLGVFLAVFSELSGITVVMYYGPTILERSGASMNSSLSGHAIIGLVLAAFTALAVLLVDRVGRRRVLLTGVAGACTALMLTGWCFWRGSTDGIVIVALLCSFVAFFAFSLGPIKWIVISEIFPTNLRARAMGVATVALWLTDIVINQAFPTVRDRLGVSTMFFVCAACLLIQFVVVARMLPETKGMTLEEIVALWKVGRGAPTV